MKLFYLHILSCLFFTVTIFAQDVSFIATVEQTVINAGEQFEVTFTVSGADAGKSTNFIKPDFSDFVVISGPNTSSSMQWINGNVSSSLSYSFILYARQSGKFTIGSASIECKGKVLKTQPIHLTINQSGKKSNSTKSNDNKIELDDNLYIKAYANKQNVKQGEQIIITYKIFSSIAVSRYELAKAPVYDGFWSEDIDMPKQPEVKIENINGKQYRTAIIKKTALFATRSGNLKIAPLELSCAVQIQSKRRSNDPFDSFFNDPFFQQVQTVNVDIKSNTLNINVNPLPANTPSGFSGGIGKFNFNASIDKSNVKAGDPITLKISVSGSGNIKLVTLPQPQLPVDIEFYEPKILENISRDGDKISGKKTAEYLLIPRNAGIRFIEPIIFSYYDLEQNSFVTYKSKKFELNIQPGKYIPSNIVSSTSKENVKILGEDIRFIKLKSSSFININDSDNSIGYILLIVFPPIIFVLSFIYRKRMEKIYGDMPKLLFEKAGYEASKRLKKAKLLLEQGDTESYNAEILKALTEYLTHKLRAQKANFSTETILEKLKEHGVKTEFIQSLKTCLERAEFARYAPSSDSTKVRKELLDIATNAINGIEQTFHKRGSK